MFSKTRVYLLAFATAAAQSSLAGPIPVVGVPPMQPQMPQMPQIAPPAAKPMPDLVKAPVTAKPPRISAPQVPQHVQGQSQSTDLMRPPALSATVDSQPTPASKLAAVLSEIPVLKAEAEAARLKADIQKAGQDSGAGGMAMPQTSVPGAIHPLASPTSSGWSLVGISGYNGSLAAEIRDASGRKRSVVVGQGLDGGWKVRSITASHVVLVRGKQRLRLGV